MLRTCRRHQTLGLPPEALRGTGSSSLLTLGGEQRRCCGLPLCSQKIYGCSGLCSTELTCSTLQTARWPSSSAVSCSAPAPAALGILPTGLQTTTRPLLPKKETCRGCADPFQGRGRWRSALSWRASQRLRCCWLLMASREPSGLTAMCSMGPSAGRH